MAESELPTRRPATPPVLVLALAATVLYLAREVLIPLALSILLTFLLAPAVMRLERIRLGRVASTMIVVVAAFAVIGALLWVAASQAVKLVENLPEYRVAIREKIDGLQGKPGDAMSRASRAVRDLGADLGLFPAPAPAAGAPAGATPAAPSGPTVTPGQQSPSRTGAGPPRGGAAPPLAPGAAPGASVGQPATMAATLSGIGAVLAPLVAPLATLGAVIVFTIVMLLQRADLRDRLYRLAGQRRISLTAQAFDEAADRISRYLRMQVIVNVAYGLPIGVGLWLLGIPNAPLWGLFAAVLRFVPYVGPWIAAAFPLALALATGEGWSLVLWTVALFLALELVSNNVIEPWLYGQSTGLSPVAILVSALFWTWLWGIPGLLLAVPLTVCVAVLGRHLPQFAFLDVMLGDTPVLQPHERVYQRLLAADEFEASGIVDAHLDEHGRADLYDAVLLPTVAMAERDRQRGHLDADRAREVVDAAMRLVDAHAPEDDASDARTPAGPTVSGGAPRAADVIVIAAHDAADGVAATMLAQLLAERGLAVETIGEEVLATEAVERIRAGRARIVCVSSVPPTAAVHAAYLCKRLRRQSPSLQVIAGLWTDEAELERAAERLRASGADAVVARLADAVETIREWSLRVASADDSRAEAAAVVSAGSASALSAGSDAGSGGVPPPAAVVAAPG